MATMDSNDILLTMYKHLGRTKQPVLPVTMISNHNLMTHNQCETPLSVSSKLDEPTLCIPDAPSNIIAWRCLSWWLITGWCMIRGPSSPIPAIGISSALLHRRHGAVPPCACASARPPRWGRSRKMGASLFLHRLAAAPYEATQNS